jgi:hypothetical protein
LNRLSHWKIEVVRLLANNESNSTGKGAAATVVAFDKEDFLPQTPVRFDTKKSLTEGDENSKMEDGIGSQLP